MNVQEVSLVDRAANERTFAVTKRSGGMPRMTKAEWTAKAKTVKAALAEALRKLAGDKSAGVAKLEFKLPTEAKQALMDALADALDRLTALATMVGDAEVDDAAAVPEELASALTQVAELLSGAASQFSGGAPAGGEEAEGEKPAGDAEGAPPGPPEGPEGKRLAKAELDSLTAATVTIGAAREQLWSVCEIMGKDPAAAAEKIKQVAGMLDSAAGFMAAGGAPAPAAGSTEEKAAKAVAEKALPAELRDGDSLKTEHADGDSLKETLQKAVAEGYLTAAKLSKAGRKIAGKRYEKLKALHDTLGSLLNELAYDEASGGGKEAPAKKSADAEPEPTVEELKKKLADATAAAKVEREALEKRVAELSKRAGEPRSAEVEGSAPVAKGDVVWPVDMSADARKRKAAEAAAAKNGKK